MSEYQNAWVFNGAPRQPVSGVFSSMVLAEEWIHSNKLSGLLTAYPIDIGVYDWAVREAIIQPMEDIESTSQYIASFTHSIQDHYHYERGKCEGIDATIEEQRLGIMPSILPQSIWLFNGLTTTHVSGVFSIKEKAESWIDKYKLNGSLILFPVDIGVYHWAIREDIFTPVSRKEKKPKFIQQFTFATFEGQKVISYREGKNKSTNK